MPRYYYLCANGTVGSADGQDIPYADCARDGDVVGGHRFQQIGLSVILIISTQVLRLIWKTTR